MSIVNLLFSFHGRINRAQYWGGTLGVSAFSFMISMLVGVSTGLAAAQADPAAALASSLGSLGLVGVVNILTFWCSLAIQVKRFHDRGRSGWLAAVPFGLVLWMVVAIIGAAASGAPAAQALGAIGLPLGLFLLCGLVFFIDLGCLPGTQGPNKFGDPPGAPSSPSTHFAPKGGAPAPAGVSTLGNAESALERAIAQRKSPSPSPQGIAPRPAMATPAPAPNMARPAGAASFGRRTTQ